MDFRPKKTLKGAWIPKIWLKIWGLVQSEPPKALGNRGKLQPEKLHQSLCSPENIIFIHWLACVWISCISSMKIDILSINNFFGNQDYFVTKSLRLGLKLQMKRNDKAFTNYWLKSIIIIFLRWNRWMQIRTCVRRSASVCHVDGHVV